MCAIFGSTGLEELNALLKQNRHRGGHSYSITEYDLITGEPTVLVKSLGSIDNIDVPEDGSLYVCHVQAPTTERTDTTAIHPAHLGGSLMWHNGIIKSHQVNTWKRDSELNTSWDTELLLEHMHDNGSDSLSGVDGSFACAYFNDELMIFRNENCPMFFNGLAFSSTWFDGSSELEAGVVYNISNNKWVTTDNTFKTNNTFFWSPE